MQLKTSSYWLLLLLCACTQPVRDQVSDDKGEYIHAAILVMDGVYNTELTAPYDILHHTRFRDSITPIKLFTISDDEKSVRTFEGLNITADYTIDEDNLPPIDILLIPSAEHHLDSDLEKKKMLKWVRNTAENADYILTFCDGAFVLAETGLLNKRHCTTFPADIDAFEKRYPNCFTHTDALWVRDGNIITSAGGARSFEPALYLCEKLYGKSVAKDIAEGMVLDWDPDQLLFLEFD